MVEFTDADSPASPLLIPAAAGMAGAVADEPAGPTPDTRLVGEILASSFAHPDAPAACARPTCCRTAPAAPSAEIPSIILGLRASANLLRRYPGVIDRFADALEFPGVHGTPSFGSVHEAAGIQEEAASVVDDLVLKALRIYR